MQLRPALRNDPPLPCWPLQFRLTSPHAPPLCLQVLVWSGVAASSSFPGLYPPQFLVGRNSKGQICRWGTHRLRSPPPFCVLAASCGGLVRKLVTRCAATLPLLCMRCAHLARAHTRTHACAHACAHARRMHQDVGVNSLQRRWRDGSLEFDLPAQALGEMFNCNHFLVGVRAWGAGTTASAVVHQWRGCCCPCFLWCSLRATARRTLRACPDPVRPPRTPPIECLRARR